jgi:hypothetical protein
VSVTEGEPITHVMRSGHIVRAYVARSDALGGTPTTPTSDRFVSTGKLAVLLYVADENITWIHGHVLDNSDEATVLLATFALTVSAA